MRHAREFFRCIYPVKKSWDEYDYFEDPPSGHLVLWTKNDSKTHWTSWRERREGPVWWWEYERDPAERARDLSLSSDVFFGVGIQGKKTAGRGNSDNVIAIPGFWADVDVQAPMRSRDDLPPTKTAALDLVRDFPVHPNIIVDSGYGLQVYWLFCGLWRLETEGERRRAEEASSRFQTVLRDLAGSRGWHLDCTADLARVLRVPGTLNYKGTVPVRTRMVWLNNRRRLPAEEFVQSIEALQPRGKSLLLGPGRATVAEGSREIPGVASIPAYVRAVRDRELKRVKDSRVGTRNESLFKSSAALGELVAGGHLDETHTFEDLQNAALSVGLEVVEIEPTIKSGFQRGAKNPRILGETRKKSGGSSLETAEPSPAGHTARTPTECTASGLGDSGEHDPRLYRPCEVAAMNEGLPPALVTGLLPTGLTHFNGRPGEGKSTLLRQLVLDVAQGRPFLGHPTRKADVAYLSLEDPTQKLLEALRETSRGDPLPDKGLFFIGSDRAVTLEALPGMSQYPTVQLWVIDPLPAGQSATLGHVPHAAR